MRRSEKEIKDKEQLEFLLSTIIVGRLGLADGDQPYIVPVTFGYADNTIYIHSANKGRKLDIIRNNAKVCFEIDTDEEVVVADTACAYGFKYKSVICFGIAEIVEDEKEKDTGLKCIMEKCTGSSDWEFNVPSMARVVVIKIYIDSMTGKQAPGKD